MVHRIGDNVALGLVLDVPKRRPQGATLQTLLSHARLVDQGYRNCRGAY